MKKLVKLVNERYINYKFEKWFKGLDNEQLVEDLFNLDSADFIYNFYRLLESCPVDFEKLFMTYDYDKNEVFVANNQSSGSNFVTLFEMPRKVYRVKELDIMAQELEEAFDNLIQTLCQEEAV